MDQFVELQMGLANGDFRAIARALTLVENNIDFSINFLKQLNINQETAVVGITGPPGAGKSTLVSALIQELCEQNKRVAILAIDPTSPFNFGSLLGDRIRMSKHFNHPNVYIRSVATRGSLGGLSARIIEMTDILKASNFDLIVVETVGVGQSEVEIAGLAQKTIVVLVPESGDEIQHLKSGIMEIAQAFVVNKADREGADTFANHLSKMVKSQNIPVFKTQADKLLGTKELCDWILDSQENTPTQRNYLLAEQVYRLIQYRRMANIDKQAILQTIQANAGRKDFNIYRLLENWD